MLAFVLIYNKTSANIENYIDKSVLETGSDLIYIDEVSSKNMLMQEHNITDKLTLYTYTNDSFLLKKENHIEKNEKGICFYNGWILKNSKIETDIKNLTDITLESDIYGQYLFANINHDGEGFIRRDLNGSNPIYYYTDENLEVYSCHLSLIFQSVKKLASKGIKNSLDDDFIIRKLKVKHNTVGSYTIIKGVTILNPQNYLLSITKNGISIIQQEDSFYNQEMHDLYRNDKTKFYDDIYNQLLGIVEFIEENFAHIKVPISGGKDSRLILALLSQNNKAFSKVFTFTVGSNDNPDVKVAKIITNELNLLHTISKSSSISEDIINKNFTFLPSHIFYCYGIRTAFDMNRYNIQMFSTQTTISLVGVQSYKNSINIAKKVLSDGGYLKSIYSDKILEIENNKAEKNQNDSNFLFREYIETCGSKWGTYSGILQHKSSFCIHLLNNDLLLKYSYALSEEARNKDEIIYEIMKRANEKLTFIPFAQDDWKNLEGVPKIEPITWSGNIKKSNYVDNINYRFLKKHSKKLKKVILKYASKQLIDKIDINKFVKTKYSEDQAYHFIELFTLTVFSNINSFYELRYFTKEEINGIPLEFQDSTFNKIYLKLKSLYNHKKEQIR